MNISTPIFIAIFSVAVCYFTIAFADSLPPTPEERSCTAEYYTPVCEQEGSDEKVVAFSFYS